MVYDYGWGCKNGSFCAFGPRDSALTLTTQELLLAPTMELTLSLFKLLFSRNHDFIE